jgi:hypothetical protein
MQALHGASPKSHCAARRVKGVFAWSAPALFAVAVVCVLMYTNDSSNS